MSPTANAEPPSPADPAGSTATVVAPTAGVPVVTPSVPALPVNVCSYASLEPHVATPIELPQAPGYFEANEPTEPEPSA